MVRAEALRRSAPRLSSVAAATWGRGQEWETQAEKPQGWICRALGMRKAAGEF